MLSRSQIVIWLKTHCFLSRNTSNMWINTGCVFLYIFKTSQRGSVTASSQDLMCCVIKFSKGAVKLKSVITAPFSPFWSCDTFEWTIRKLTFGLFFSMRRIYFIFIFLCLKRLFFLIQTVRLCPWWWITSSPLPAFNNKIIYTINQIILGTNNSLVNTCIYYIVLHCRYPF